MSEEAVKAGIHIPAGKPVNFPYPMTDGDKCSWDLQNFGSVVGQNNGSPYANGPLLQISNANFQAGNAWVNAAGDEIELGPFRTGKVTVYRRIKVYKDEGLARWLDIFECDSDQEATIPVAVFTNTMMQITQTLGSGGGNGFGGKDWAFITDGIGGGGPSSLLHIVCDAKSKVRPEVTVQGNSIFVRYNVKVKPHSTAILCYFEAQGQTTGEHVKALRTFRAAKALKDLPAAARKLIVNFDSKAGGEGVDLDRSDKGDCVVQAGGEPIFGTIVNESFTVVSPSVGERKLPAAQVVGMAADSPDTGVFRVLLTDGQVLVGTVAEPKLLLKRDGGDLEVPLDRIGQWSFRISTQRPSGVPTLKATISLRTGERLKFDPADLKLHLRTLHGDVSPAPKDLVSIRLDNAGSLHRATFTNGSSLAVLLQDDPVTVTLSLLDKAHPVARHLIRAIDFGDETPADPRLARLSLTNGDELLGELADEKITLATDFGAVDLKPDTIRHVTPLGGEGTRVAVVTWDGTTLRGRLTQEALGFVVLPGPTLKIAPSRIARLVRMQPMSPEETRKRVESLVAMLAAESLKDRQQAADDLLRMGPTIVPLLQKNAASPDNEVRQRIQDLLERFAGDKTPPPTPDRFRRW